jgi:L-2-hydroxyglutarate oxidase LhgO
MARTVDFAIIGAGIVGLAIARELKLRYPNSKIVILEKESSLGKHASGRNSGVLHSGIYYAEGSLKAKVCAQGSREMAAYCDEYQLPISRLGKVIIPLREGDEAQLNLLYNRAKNNGARVEMLDEKQLREIEPDAYSLTGQALYSPDTAVVDSKAILNHLADSLRNQGVEILFGYEFGQLGADGTSFSANGETIHFGHLFNTAGLYADSVAKAFDIGKKYTILPFKGLYYKLSESSGIKINGLIYPVPDLKVPFLGVHFTKKLNNEVYLGPTAIPALGRENYSGLAGLNFSDVGSILLSICQQYANNKQGFRQLVHEESPRLFKKYFALAATKLVPTVKPEHLLKSDYVGIRAQLLDQEKQELVMDFVMESGKNSTHILNAVSPAFTSAFSFSRLVLEESGIG